jgi:hypothetical protein
MKKPAVMLTLTIIALLTVGYSYAYKNGGINIKPNKFDIAFANVIANDNEAEIDVAITSAQITPDGNTINVYISNAYPGYEAYVTYTIQNTGKMPAHFISLTITNPNPEALEITTTDHTGTWLSPDQTVHGTTTIRILQEAKQNWQYQFQISIGISFQEKRPRSIGFWKQQFSTNLDKRGKPQIDARTLEQYLNQINSQSQIFKFTGTQQQKLQKALDILEMPKRPTMLDKLKAQLLTLWLNSVAGWTEGYTLNGMTAQDIIEGSENAITKQLTGEYECWKDLCESFNKLGGE